MQEIPGVLWDNGGNAYAELGNYDGEKQLMKLWLAEPTGQELFTKFNDQANIEKIYEQLEFHGWVVSVVNLTFIYEALRDSGQLVSPAAPQLTRAGVPLTAPQKQWKEFREYSEAHSMTDVRTRMKTDAGFANFVRKNYERELERPGDGRLPEDAVRNDAPAVSDYEYDSLKTFADNFNKMQSSEAKKKFLPAFNSRHAEFAAKFEQCRALRLL